jgi:hypothetical protein
MIRWGLLAMVLMALGSAGGASCPQMMQQYTRPLPRILPAGASAEQIVAAVNTNTSRVRTLHAPQARIDGRGFPALRSNLIVERPARFRLTAEAPMGPEVDLGSNDELFWMWARRPQPTLYYCRHDRFAASAARQMFPVEPSWLVEALGLVELDPQAQHSGPFDAGVGRLRIETRGAPRAPVRVTIVDSGTGWVLEQQLYDPSGRLLAHSVASGHRLDAASGAGLPRRVDVQWPPTGLELRIDLGDPIINQVDGVSPTLFVLPEYSGSTRIDLGDPNVQLGPR